MKTIDTALAGCKIVEPLVHGDSRGFFFEAFNQARPFAEAVKCAQINVSRSSRGVLRGLHFQHPEPQGKLVWVLEGEVFDVAVDINPHSKSYRRWEAVVLSAENKRQFYIPEGYAHGFQVLSEFATFCYMCTRSYRAEFDQSVAFHDPAIAVEWPIAQGALLSDKDRAAPLLSEIEHRLRKAYEDFTAGW
jgi:dTDP-4-dehydrorhamnose 3,5-epimerase